VIQPSASSADRLAQGMGDAIGDAVPLLELGADDDRREIGI
jgi:hypothetical protein